MSASHMLEHCYTYMTTGKTTGSSRIVQPVKEGSGDT